MLGFRTRPQTATSPITDVMRVPSRPSSGQASRSTLFRKSGFATTFAEPSTCAKPGARNSWFNGKTDSIGDTLADLGYGANVDAAGRGSCGSTALPSMSLPTTPAPASLPLRPASVTGASTCLDGFVHSQPPMTRLLGASTVSNPSSHSHPRLTRISSAPSQIGGRFSDSAVNARRINEFSACPRLSTSNSISGVDGRKLSGGMKSSGGGVQAVSRTANVRRGKRRDEGESKTRGLLGANGALEVDKEFQQKQLQKWAKSSEKEDLAAQVRQRRFLQFFDFLRAADGDGFVSGYESYIPLAFSRLDTFEGEPSNVKMPEFDFSQVVELMPQQTLDLKQVLRDYAKASRPVSDCHINFRLAEHRHDNNNRRHAVIDANKVGEEPGPYQLLRPTFCRFLIDCRLVEGANGAEGCPRFHRAVRMFDALSRISTKVADDVEQLGPTMGYLRSATLDQCVALVSQLLGQTSMPTQAVWSFFEHDLRAAHRAIKVLLDRASDAARDVAAEAAKAGFSKDKRDSRHASVLGNHSLPPGCMKGIAMKDWGLGLRGWMETVDLQLTKESARMRTQQFHQYNNFVSDMMCEPGVLHICASFDGLFAELYEVYSDEVLIKFDPESQQVETPVSHMSLAAFFRFCLDFSIFPDVCSFNEAWLAYSAAECVVTLPKRISASQRMSKLKNVLRAATRFNETLKKKQVDAAAAKAIKQHIEEEAEQPTGSNKIRIGKNKTTPMSRTKSVAIVSSEPAPSKENAAETNPPVARTRSGVGVPALNVLRPPPLTIVSGLLDESNKKDTMSAVPEMPTPVSSVGKLSPSSGVLSQHSKKKRKKPEMVEQPPAPVVRVKAAANVAWVGLDFTMMTEVRRAAYALLAALSFSSTDNFFSVRGLFAANGERGDEEGYVTSEVFFATVNRLELRHQLQLDDAKAIFRVLWPNGEDPVCLTEIEKAATAVREDLAMREIDAGISWALAPSYLSGPILLKFGEAARCESDEDAWIKGPKDEMNARTAFGPAAFMETLLRLTLRHLHASGNAIQSSVTGGVKGLWLISFLHHRFEMSIRAMKNATPWQNVLRRGLPDGAPSPLNSSRMNQFSCHADPASCLDYRRSTSPGALPASQASTRPPTRDDSRPATRDGLREGDSRSPRPTSTSPRPSTVGSSLGLPERRSLRSSLHTPELLSEDLHSNEAIEAPQVLVTVPAETRCDVFSVPVVETSGRTTSTRHVSKLEKLLTSKPDIFSKYPMFDCPNALALPTGSNDKDSARSSESVQNRAGKRNYTKESPPNGFSPDRDPCPECGTMQLRGVGNIHCHACGSCDRQPLTANLLLPVLERQRLRNAMANGEKHYHDPSESLAEQLIKRVSEKDRRGLCPSFSSFEDDTHGAEKM